MFVQSTHCDDERLQRLLDGTLTARAEVEVETHIAGCTDCRERLEGLAAKNEWWQETRDLLVNVETSSGPQHVNGPMHSKLDSLQPPPLAFLSPSDNPAMLGRLGEFEVLEFIGRGGMGLVLKGYDHELNRFVAIKVLAAHYAENGAARKRFAREAQAAAAVVHQHVVAIHAVDAMHQPPYFVMAYVPGESLQQRLDRDGPLEVQDVLRIGQQVAEGLAAAHAQGLVHRDIKPANILLERNVERVLLTDFGLARAVDDASLTQSGIIAGTPQYMSPEQARGEALDHRADLFSLGSVLYALLSGHPPFRAETPYGVLRRVTDDEPRSIREINAAVPDWLEALIFRLLMKRPADRWPTAQEVADILQRCLAHIQQPQSVAIPRELQTIRRNRHRPIARSMRWPLVAALSLLAGSMLMAVTSNLLSGRHAPLREVVRAPAVQRSPVAKHVGPAKQIPPLPSNSAVMDAMSWDGDYDREYQSIDGRLQRLAKEPEF